VGRESQTYTTWEQVQPFSAPGEWRLGWGLLTQLIVRLSHQWWIQRELGDYIPFLPDQPSRSSGRLVGPPARLVGGAKVGVGVGVSALSGGLVYILFASR
jgi:hypothetical protein